MPPHTVLRIAFRAVFARPSRIPGFPRNHLTILLTCLPGGCFNQFFETTSRSLHSGKKHEQSLVWYRAVLKNAGPAIFPDGMAGATSLSAHVEHH
jgi:hypothetical protein